MIVESKRYCPVFPDTVFYIKWSMKYFAGAFLAFNISVEDGGQFGGVEIV